MTHQSALQSTITFGPPDLDLRPAELKRSSIFAWIERCHSCGYCAGNIEEASEETNEIVRSSEYRGLLENPVYPRLAASFLCAALVYADLGEEAAAAQRAIEAAWVCDDAGAIDAATQCRLRAVDLLRESEAEGDELYSDPATEYAVIVDLLRRSGRFDEAVAQADAAFPFADAEVAAVLAFSRSLAVACDLRSYTVADAVAAAG
jgi:hypothetical protein